MSNKEFKDFQKYFKEYQQKFGLTGYQVYFKYEPLDDGSFAQIVNDRNQSATVTLNSSLPDRSKPFKDVRRSAKHEAIHLLLWRLENNAKWRYASKEEIDEAVEELVYKLEKLID